MMTSCNNCVPKIDCFISNNVKHCTAIHSLHWPLLHRSFVCHLSILHNLLMNNSHLDLNARLYQTCLISFVLQLSYLTLHFGVWLEFNSRTLEWNTKSDHEYRAISSNFVSKSEKACVVIRWKLNVFDN